MSTGPEPTGRPTGRSEPGTANPRPGRQMHDPYRPEYTVVLAVSPQMRARYPDSPLSLEEAIHLGTRQPGSSTSTAGQQGAIENQSAAEHKGGLSFWTELPGTLAAPSRARAAVRHVLTSWGLASLSPDAELLACELVANAAEHGPGYPIGLLIRQHTTQAGQPGIKCEITDNSPQQPQAEPTSADTDRGRGLSVVAALADHSGYIARPGSKTAWFTLTTSEPARIAEPEAEAGA